MPYLIFSFLIMQKFLEMPGLFWDIVIEFSFGLTSFKTCFPVLSSASLCGDTVAIQQVIGPCGSHWALPFFMSWRTQGSNIAHSLYYILLCKSIPRLRVMMHNSLAHRLPSLWYKPHSIWIFFIRYSSSHILWNIIKEGWHQRRTCWYLIFGSGV